MLTDIYARNVPEALFEALWKVKICGVENSSRNGPVFQIPGITCLEIANPMERVLFSPVRDANPFFHVMEFVWMMAGRDDDDSISYYNRRMEEYAEDNGVIHGAYGHRWIHHFGVDQIGAVIRELQANPNSRRAYLGMWDPRADLPPDKRDHPCNVGACFQTAPGTPDLLDMTVFNRSNDIIWGMLGANAVHMTFLHELVAASTGLEIGTYRVASANAHFYQNAYKNGEALLAVPQLDDRYINECEEIPSFADTDYEQFRLDCGTLWEGSLDQESHFFVDLIYPIMDTWDLWKAKKLDMALEMVSTIQNPDWRLACHEWISRRIK